MRQPWRKSTALVVVVTLISPGCSSINKATGNDIERADDLGLPLPGISIVQPAGDSTRQQQMPGTLPPGSIGAYDQIYRDAFVEQWMARSDYLCRQYKDKIIRTARDWKLGTDVLTTTLAGLATIFTAVGTIRPLAGAATIVSGTGAAAQTDVFAQQAGDLIAAAIQTARENQANQIEHNLSSPIKVYNIYRAQRDVIEYHNMCSLETALKQIRASLQQTSPDAGRTPPAAQGNQTPGGAIAPELQQPRSLPGAKDLSINKATDAVPPATSRPPDTSQRNGRSQYERSLSSAQVKKMQSALCVPPDGMLGKATWAAVDDYLAGSQNARSPTIEAWTWRLIDKAIADVPNCTAKGFLTAFEVGRYGVTPAGVNPADQGAMIMELQGKLKVKQHPFFDSDTRNAIKQKRKDVGLPEADGQIDDATVLGLLRLGAEQ